MTEPALIVAEPASTQRLLRRSTHTERVVDCVDDGIGAAAAHRFEAGPTACFDLVLHDVGERQRDALGLVGPGLACETVHAETLHGPITANRQSTRNG